VALIDQLIEALRVLPGVGPKSAQRMAYHVLERERVGGKRLADVLAQAVEQIRHCARCRDFSETEVCAICASASRDAHLLCAVDRPPIVWRSNRRRAIAACISSCRAA